MGEQDEDNFFHQCWNPEGNINTKNFCNSKFNKEQLNASSVINECNRDFCIMCCNLRDVMFNRIHSIKAISKCQQKCTETYI